MTIVTHALATTLGVRVLRLTGSDAVLAYVFGVGLDIDHVIKAPYYLRHVGRKRKLGYYWRTSLQEPVALLWIIPLCFFLGTWVPALFFLIHLAMDYSVGYEKMPWYPYTPLVTQGFLAGVSDRTKEAVLIVVLLCMNLLLFLAPL
jgi:sterol desaturase/sphingolipid hydroxylase (fatty acid hydroxylase superfamily)